MSIHQEQTVKCSSCDHEQQTVVYQSINVADAPDLKEKLFNGEINTFTCEKCSEKSFLTIPLLYHDQVRKFCVQYYPVTSIEDKDFLLQFDEEGQLNFEGIPEEIVNNAGYMTEPHITFEINEFLRYIVFRDQLYQIHHPGIK